MEPRGAWSGSRQNYWYIQSTSFNYLTNQIFSIAITDMTTHATATMAPTGWYRNGGAMPIPGLNSMRRRSYAETNAMLIDNVTLTPTPEPAVFGLVGVGLVLLSVVNRKRRGSAVL